MTTLPINLDAEYGTDKTSYSAPRFPSEFEEAATAQEIINDLGRIYLEAGLPLAAAFEAALADYQTVFANPVTAAA